MGWENGGTGRRTEKIDSMSKPEGRIPEGRPVLRSSNEYEFFAHENRLVGICDFRVNTAEGGKKPEVRDPKGSQRASRFGIRTSTFFRISAFGSRPLAKAGSTDKSRFHSAPPCL